MFTTGGWGGYFYASRYLYRVGEDIELPGRDHPSGQTVEKMRVEGYETYEVNWKGERGWGTDISGQGLKKPMCAYAELVRWIATNLADNPDVMGATGGSAGSWQIAYGLALYGLEDIFDVVVLTGGPAAADMVYLCYGKEADSFGGAMAYVMGWVKDYCGNDSLFRQGERLEWTVAALQAENIVSTLPGDLRDYHYPHTKVAFVEDERDPATELGKIYHDAITSEKSWVVLPGVGHGVDGDPIGAATIQEVLLEGLRLVEDRPD